MIFDEISDHFPRKESPVTGAMPFLVEDAWPRWNNWAEPDKRRVGRIARCHPLSYSTAGKLISRTDVHPLESQLLLISSTRMIPSHAKIEVL